MLIAGTGDGAYRVTGLQKSAETAVEKVLDVPRVERVRQFDAVDGVFAATETGLYHTLDGTEWTDLRVPRETVWAVGCSPTGERLYAGTRPTRIYASTSPPERIVSNPGAAEWREFEGFTDLPSREEWGVPRHNNVAQVRSLCVPRASPERIFAGVEPGGVHVSTDGGETWEERRDGVHDDIHELHLRNDGLLVASTGVGLYRSTDAGQSWKRLDDDVEQRYFRASYLHDGVLYTSAACTPPDEWESDDADPALFECRDGHTLETVTSPRPDEVIVGWATFEGDVIGASHRGTLLRKRGEEWTIVGEIPTPDTLSGRYVSLAVSEQ